MFVAVVATCADLAAEVRGSVGCAGGIFCACRQQVESLVGSLKAAKKRGIVTFEGQMLLQGAHDHVVVTLNAEHVPP